jgi:hypothetical protein
VGRLRRESRKAPPDYPQGTDSPLNGSPAKKTKGRPASTGRPLSPRWVQ